MAEVYRQAVGQRGGSGLGGSFHSVGLQSSCHAVVSHNLELPPMSGSDWCQSDGMWIGVCVLGVVVVGWLLGGVGLSTIIGNSVKIDEGSDD